MEYQKIHIFGDGSSNEGEAHKTANEEEETLLNIDFDNVEDILDFSAHSLSETGNSENLEKRPPQLRKMVAEKPIKLLELKPIIDHFVDCNEKNRRFQCIFCGDQFIRSTHLYRHLRIHTGVKPYSCHICRKRFSRKDYLSAHILCHRKDKVHHCFICGEVYHDLTRFAYHCSSHDEKEYTRKETNESHCERQVQIVGKKILASTFAKQLESTSCVMIEKIDNSTDEEHIVCVKNPIYPSHHQAISINNNDVTSLSGCTSSSNGTGTKDSFMVSINVAFC